MQVNVLHKHTTYIGNGAIYGLMSIKEEDGGGGDDDDVGNIVKMVETCGEEHIQ